MSNHTELNEFLGTQPDKHNDDQLDETSIRSAITNRVLELLDRDPALLFSYMYRLDVLESKIQYALNIQKTVLPHIALADLIWARQKERLALRQKFKSDPIDGFDW